MDMIKYIVKRLLLSVLILFGVSVIIYSLARMMPTDYVDNQYSSAVSQGTMRQEDVDRIKELYGLSMPDAYLRMKVGTGSSFAGDTFSKNTKQATYDEDVSLGLMTWEAWYEGSYDGPHNTRLVINADGTFSIGTVESRGLHVEAESSAAETSGGETESSATGSLITLDEKYTPVESGTYRLVAGEGGDASSIRQVVCTLSDGTELTIAAEYRLAGFWDKAGAVLSGYFSWLFNVVRGDLGMSFKYKKPVKDVIFQNMGISFAIAFVATLLQFLISIPLGIKAATHQYGFVDYSVTVFSMTGISLPTFFLAALVIRIFAVDLGWFEVGGIADGCYVVAAAGRYALAHGTAYVRAGGAVHRLADALYQNQHAGGTQCRLRAHGTCQRSDRAYRYLQARIPQYHDTACHHDGGYSAEPVRRCHDYRDGVQYPRYRQAGIRCPDRGGHSVHHGLQYLHRHSDCHRHPAERPDVCGG